ncbi:hypothetical protein CNQ36_15105 [Streptomyces fungicidicus]|uniref:Uncharacterized protein n=1 Tax=Streptomyces fungicidicus TaxID=68203 RepID=A0A494UT82_9ACTN|nr:hypothetical protein CNQ36_15105 [Streptomyces fungicidicus]
MRDTVRPPAGPVARTPAFCLATRRGAAGTGRYGTASGAAPARRAPGTTRIPHKLPERTSDSGP